MTTTTRTTTCPTCRVDRARYIVERDEQFDDSESCMVMSERGVVHSFANPKEAKRFIDREEKAIAKRDGSARIAAIEWRDGLNPPRGV